MTRDIDRDCGSEHVETTVQRRSEPGKRTLTNRLGGGTVPTGGAVQLLGGTVVRPSPAIPLEDPFGMHLLDAPVQRKEAGGAASDDAAVATAASGLTGTAQPLPHSDAIQRSFGRH